MPASKKWADEAAKRLADLLGPQLALDAIELCRLIPGTNKSVDATLRDVHLAIMDIKHPERS